MAISWQFLLELKFLFAYQPTERHLDPRILIDPGFFIAQVNIVECKATPLGSYTPG
ncbi:hypothetical protein E5288_WYG003386 [Bos mutus]|uniref:Uncharacterized protein n=1 Tax=Bos mutus TaxID=72004 RepID=A0A6B0RL72_9CETA|nr:hypothetical protein [Bos mutus]